ncbi:basal-body rod modification protein FlgD [Litchfieldella qijiaojingensis]|uniref:Basal-body rod modification protein FlgD n=1 Tax=Litchfieldella qijiaojingensis TaxID=980347 RepID=A0ABQ2YD48_9GAMM|nr:flagellar hook assembly protein FlgD [Halomonas qijiaojingensis]GGX77963.1 basal-body rod modification protein FlgD [Halomonas qijiaojingensis]
MATTIDSSVINRLNNAGAAGGGTSKSDDLRENFMTLLVTQLQNQDPLNPMENAEMTSQLAQINTVSGIEELNSTLKGITGQIDAGHTLQAAALIGQGVLVPGDRLLVGEEGTTPFGVELEKAADEVVVTIRDGAGQVVRSFDVGPVDAGVESFEWDGTLESGERAPEGAYQVSVEASAGDEPVVAAALNYAQVRGVSTASDGSPRLDLGGVSEQASLADIRQILRM